MKFIRFILFFLLFCFSLSAEASTVWWAASNFLNGLQLTNQWQVQPYKNNIGVGTGYFATGPPFRLSTTNGFFTNWFAPGLYTATVLPSQGQPWYSPTPIQFSVPNDGAAYNLLALTPNPSLAALSFVEQITSTNGSVIVSPGIGMGSVDISVIGGSATNATFLNGIAGAATLFTTNVAGNTNAIFIFNVAGGIMVSNIWNTNAVGGGASVAQGVNILNTTNSGVVTVNLSSNVAILGTLSAASGALTVDLSGDGQFQGTLTAEELFGSAAGLTPDTLQTNAMVPGAPGQIFTTLPSPSPPFYAVAGWSSTFNGKITGILNTAAITNSGPLVESNSEYLYLNGASDGLIVESNTGSAWVQIAGINQMGNFHSPLGSSVNVAFGPYGYKTNGFWLGSNWIAAGNIGGVPVMLLSNNNFYLPTLTPGSLLAIDITGKIIYPTIGTGLNYSGNTLSCTVAGGGGSSGGGGAYAGGTAFLVNGTAKVTVPITVDVETNNGTNIILTLFGQNPPFSTNSIGMVTNVVLGFGGSFYASYGPGMTNQINWQLQGTNSSSGTGSGSQTPWIANENAGNFSLTNLFELQFGNLFTISANGMSNAVNTATVYNLGGSSTVNVTTGNVTNLNSATANVSGAATALNFTATQTGLANSGFTGNAQGLTNGLPCMVNGVLNTSLNATAGFVAVYDAGGVGAQTTDAAAHVVISRSGTVTNYYVNVVTTLGPGSNVIYQLYHNGSSTPITCTALHNSQSANDTAHSFSVTAGDTMSLLVTPALGGNENLYYSWSFEIE